MNLLTLSPTTAIAAKATPWVSLSASPRALTIQGNFTYGSGGTSFDAYVQVSLDGGATAVDVANFHWTTASARFVYNLSSQQAVTAQYTATDGTMAANTAANGILSPMVRVKYVSVGTYAASAVSIDVQADLIPSYP